jgi:DNA-directed RNA polymerase subunit N
MLIPVRCFTCNKVLGDKYILYVSLSEEYMEKEGVENPDDIRYMDTSKKQDYSPYGKAMNDLGLTRYCCRRHMLGHVDVIDDL